VQAQVALSTTTSFELREALLVYRSDRSYSSSSNQGPSTFVTKHPVKTTREGAPSLGPGAPIEKGDVFSLIQQLRGSIPVEFLPANVLVRTQESVVWWTPSAIRPMFYSKEKGVELAQLSGKRFPQPPLLFRAQARHMDVRALARDERPTLNTPLFRAPYWNVSDSGDVCLGSTKVPREASVDSLAKWEHAFFESEFTHANGSSKLCEHPGGFIGLWKSLIGKKRFPSECLANANQTLGKFINR
jgi:PRTRC genetic system protein B